MVSYEDALVLKEGILSQESKKGAMNVNFRLPDANNDLVSIDYYFFSTETSCLEFIEQFGYFLKDNDGVEFHPHFAVFELNTNSDFEETAASTEDCIFDGRYCAFPDGCNSSHLSLDSSEVYCLFHWNASPFMLFSAPHFNE